MFALDVDSGEILWQYDGEPRRRDHVRLLRLDEPRRRVGDGKVFMGQLDGKLVALDARHGQGVWSMPSRALEEGYTITSAPLYYDGLVVDGLSRAPSSACAAA